MNAPSVLPLGLIPSEYFAFIAGGYAACPQRAVDIDVWVIAERGEVEATYRRILAFLQDNRWAIEAAPTPSEDDLLQEESTYELTGVSTLKVCRVPYPHPITQQPSSIHIMVADGDVNAVLNGFDVSTHQIALLWNDREERGVQWTPLDVPPQIITAHENKFTEGRMAKITARYADLALAHQAERV